jgi:hypothetical protein
MRQRGPLFCFQAFMVLLVIAIVGAIAIELLFYAW